MCDSEIQILIQKLLQLPDTPEIIGQTNPNGVGEGKPVAKQLPNLTSNCWVDGEGEWMKRK